MSPNAIRATSGTSAAVEPDLDNNMVVSGTLVDPQETARHPALSLTNAVYNSHGNFTAQSDQIKRSTVSSSQAGNMAATLTRAEKILAAKSKAPTAVIEGKVSSHRKRKAVNRARKVLTKGDKVNHNVKNPALELVRKKENQNIPVMNTSAALSQQVISGSSQAANSSFVNGAGSDSNALGDGDSTIGSDGDIDKEDVFDENNDTDLEFSSPSYTPCSDHEVPFYCGFPTATKATYESDSDGVELIEDVALSNAKKYYPSSLVAFTEQLTERLSALVAGGDHGYLVNEADAEDTLGNREITDAIGLSPLNEPATGIVAELEEAAESEEPSGLLETNPLGEIARVGNTTVQEDSWVSRSILSLPNSTQSARQPSLHSSSTPNYTSTDDNLKLWTLRNTFISTVSEEELIQYLDFDMLEGHTTKHDICVAYAAVAADDQERLTVTRPDSSSVDFGNPFAVHRIKIGNVTLAAFLHAVKFNEEGMASVKEVMRAFEGFAAKTRSLPHQSDRIVRALEF